ncbi:MAG: hypothetical protein ACK5MY_10525, partial [Jhaorihella sp.]
MRSLSLAVVGCGDLGMRLAALLPETVSVTGLRRDISQLPREINAIAADYTRPGQLDALAVLAPDIVVASLKPAGR